MRRIAIVCSLYLSAVALAGSAPHPFDRWPLPFDAWQLVQLLYHPGTSAGTRHIDREGRVTGNEADAVKSLDGVFARLSDKAKESLVAALSRDRGVPRWMDGGGRITEWSKLESGATVNLGGVLALEAGASRYLFLSQEYGVVFMNTLVFQVDKAGKKFTPLVAVPGGVVSAYRSASGLVLCFGQAPGDALALVLVEKATGRLRPVARIRLDLNLDTTAGSWYPVDRSMFLLQHKPVTVKHTPFDDGTGPGGPAAVVAEDKIGRIVVAPADWPEPAEGFVPGGQSFFKGASYVMYWMDNTLTRVLRSAR